MLAGMHKLRRPSIRQTNNILFVAIVCINSYVILAPLYPRVGYWWQEHHTSRRAELSHKIHTATPGNTARPSQANSIIAPGMFLDAPTFEAPEKDWVKVLNRGIWRWPGSSTPDKGGNTVFLSHRFGYTGPRGNFYYLDKLHKGDEIAVIWNNTYYIYAVTSTTQISPAQTDILDNTTDNRITLYTCTPLWHPVNRLVVVATLKEKR